MNFPKDAVIFASEPLEGRKASDIRQWLNKNATESALATALAQVGNKTGWLCHDLDELEEPELSKAETTFNEWWNLENELYNKIIEILECENTQGKASLKISNKGLHYVVLPFMERNGYRDRAGWWVLSN